MIAIVDGGSTKCDWVILDHSGKISQKTETLGFNPNIINTIARSAYLFGKKIHDLPHVHTDRVQYSDRSARFSRDDFLSLSAHHQRIWLRTIVGVLSQHAFSLTLQQKNELIQLISGTKRTSGSLTIGPLKLTQKGVTVLLLYTGDL